MNINAEIKEKMKQVRKMTNLGVPIPEAEQAVYDAFKARYPDHAFGEVVGYVARKPDRYWMLETVKRIALQFEARKAFRGEENGAYQWAQRKGVMDEVCSHMPKHASCKRRDG